MKDSGIKKSINFDDVGVPGFKGERAERIVYKNDAQVLLNVLSYQLCRSTLRVFINNFQDIMMI